MSQIWTIVDTATGEVLCQSFETDSFGVHPKDRGWPWDPETQRAIRLDVQPNPLIEVWDGGAWQPNMAVLKVQRWETIKARRDRAQDAGCNTPLGRVDSDEGSRGKINGAVSMAMLAVQQGQPFEVPWTMQDNTVVVHDAPAMMLMGVLVGQHVMICHGIATAKREAVEATTDPVGLEMIDIDGGWPA